MNNTEAKFVVLAQEYLIKATETYYSSDKDKYIRMSYDILNKLVEEESEEEECTSN